MNRLELLVVIAMLVVLRPAGASAQDRSFPLETVSGLTLISATAEPVEHEGKKGLRVVASDEALRRYTPADGELNPMAVIQGIEFSSGVIEAEIAGEPGPCAGEGARGFVGIAFRVQKDPNSYDAFYLRPTNGRSDDQVRRNHSRSTSRIPRGPGSGSARRRRKNMRRTWTSCPARGPGSGLKCAASRRVCTCTISRSPRSSSTTSSLAQRGAAPSRFGSGRAPWLTSGT